ncbi:MAG TPA: double-strand break repair protein AddB, partial [Stellaceae bacterium]|nr:double-strand break repair protein AddB [Stellaceae bacterium]
MRRPTVYTIASDLSFLDALVAGVSAETSEDPLALAGYTILLPTRRAVRALREAFLRAGGGRPLLLPRLMPVGDLDADELAFVADETEGAFGGLDIPPAMPELRRQLLLTGLVLAWGQARGTGPSTPGQAAPLARELARFLDEVQTEGRELAQLATL